MGRPRDPKRARRQTGHREKPGEAKVCTALVLPHTLDAAVVAQYAAGLPEPAVDMLGRAIAEVGDRCKEADLEALRIMALAAFRHQQAQAHVDAHGMILDTPFGPKVNPMLKVGRDEAALYLKIAEQYGLTLSARLRLGLTELVGQSLLANLNKLLDE